MMSDGRIQMSIIEVYWEKIFDFEYKGQWKVLTETANDLYDVVLSTQHMTIFCRLKFLYIFIKKK